MEIAPLVGNADVTASDVLFAVVLIRAAIRFLRHLPLDFPQAWQVLAEKLRRLNGKSFVGSQECFESEVETADFTRADFVFDDHLLHHRETYPQPPRRVTLHCDGFDLALHRTMLHKFVLTAQNVDMSRPLGMLLAPTLVRVLAQFPPRLLKGEGGIFLYLLKTG